MNDSDQTGTLGPLSKTNRKAAMRALQNLGEALIALSEERLAQLNLPEILLDAILEAQRLTARGALARQRQYIGRLMREVDATPIAEQLKRWQRSQEEDNAHLHHLEGLRARLLQDDAALTDYLRAHPNVDGQRLRSLIRKARQEVKAGKPPTNSRVLFRLLREQVIDG